MHVRLILPDRLHETRSPDRVQFHGHCSMKCVNTVSAPNNKRKKTKKEKSWGLFLLLAFNFWPPSFPLLSLSLLPNRPLLPHPPGVSWDPSLLLSWQRLNHLTVVPDTAPPHLLLLVCSCLPALFSAASLPSQPPKLPPALSVGFRTKKSPNHSGKWGIWWWDDPPRFFSSLPKPLKWLQQS